MATPLVLCENSRPKGNWTTRGLADAAKQEKKHAKSPVASASCPVRELAIRELAYPRVVRAVTGLSNSNAQQQRRAEKASEQNKTETPVTGIKVVATSDVRTVLLWCFEES